MKDKIEVHESLSCKDNIGHNHHQFCQHANQIDYNIHGLIYKFVTLAYFLGFHAMRWDDAYGPRMKFG